MCKILVGIKKEGEDRKFRDLIKAQYEDMKTEQDGISVAILKNNGELFCERRLTDYEPVFEKVDDLLSEARILAIHTRSGTSGEKDLANVHFFRENDYLFAHNGYVSAFHTPKYPNRLLSINEFGYRYEPHLTDEEASGLIINCRGCQTSHRGFCKKHKRIAQDLDGYDYGRDIVIEEKEINKVPVINDKMCDSWHFLNKLPKQFDKEKLNEYIKEVGFSGFGIIINAKTNEFTLIIRKDCKFIKTNNFALITSFEPENEFRTISVQEAFGIKYIKEEDEEIEYPTYDIIQEIYNIKVENNKRTIQKK